jgi:Tol biopolymer transport system component
MKKKNTVIFLLLPLITSLVLAYSYLFSQSFIDITCISPKPCAQISQSGRIQFEFSHPVEATRIESLWKIFPMTDGNWEWLDDRHAVWSPKDLLPTEQTFTAQFKQGIAGSKGQKIKETIRWDIEVRRPRILAVGSTTNGNELFSISLDGSGEIAQITETNGKLQDFTPSPDGESILLPIENNRLGMDLWLFSWAGKDDNLLLECGADRCKTPAWSPVMNQVAYTREIFSAENDTWEAARVYILDLLTSQTTPVINKSETTGSNPTFSPDGSWISFWNESSGGIELVNPLSGDTFQLKTSSGTVGCWSPDSRSYFYSDLLIGPGDFQSVVFRAGIADHPIAAVLMEDKGAESISVGNPACSPSSPEFAAVVQSNIRIAGRELKIFDLETNSSISVSSDLSKIPLHYSWSPAGDQLVFQLNTLGMDEWDTQILVWDRITGTNRLIGEGLKFPKWLP